MMVVEFSAEVNRFHNEENDICSISDATNESFLHGKYIADLVEDNIVYMEMAENIAPQERVDSKSPSLFDVKHQYITVALIRETREEKAKAINYNMVTGRIRRWY